MSSAQLTAAEYDEQLAQRLAALLVAAWQKKAIASAPKPEAA
jgi:hypothetical protein